MKTKAVRIYGANDLRLEEFELPTITADEVLIRVVSDTLCTSTYKAVRQGSAHKRVPDDIAENPVVIGHEMCGEIIEIGSNLKDKWKIGQRIVIQPALKLESNFDPGYSYPYIGGNMTYAVVPKVVLERDCMVAYEGESFFEGSLVEAIGCVLRAFKGMYHTDYTTYERCDGAKVGGKIAILGGAGPMGMAAIELAVNYAKANTVVVTDIDEKRLAYAKKMCPPEKAAEKGVSLIYVNTINITDTVAYLKEISDGGFDDVFVMVSVPELVSIAEQIARFDGCINFFAGPAVHNFPGTINMYRVHYDGIHMLGTAGSIPEDTVDTIKLIEDKVIDPAVMVSHIMGIDAVKDAIFAMETPSGAKKVCYNGIDLPLVAVDDFEKLGESDPLFAKLAQIVKENNGLWCAKAEKYLLEQKGAYRE